jgi:predicted Zn-dependent protease
VKYSNPKIPEGINTTETHPLKEFMFLLSVVLTGVLVITVILTLTIDWTAKYIPFSFEQAMVSSGDEIFDNERNEVDDYLQSLTDKIITSAELPEDFSITVHYVDEDVVNAGATLGGNIMVYRGLLEKIPDENTLVMLLGHEIGHVKLRHPVQALGKGVVIGMVLAAVLGQSSDSVAKLMSDTSMVAMLSFSREQEEDSDEEGLKILNNYYGHTRGSTTLFEIFKDEEATNDGYDRSEFLSSHPLTENRILHIREFTSDHQWAVRGEMKQIPAHIIKKLAFDKEQENTDSDE